MRNRMRYVAYVTVIAPFNLQWLIKFRAKGKYLFRNEKRKSDVKSRHLIFPL